MCIYHWMTCDEMCLALKVLLGNWVALKLHLCWTSCRITSAFMKTDPTTSAKRWKWEWSQPPWIASLTFYPQLQLRKMKTTGMKWWVDRDGLPILFSITELCNTTLHARNGLPWKRQFLPVITIFLNPSGTSGSQMVLEKWRIVISTTCTCMLILQVYQSVHDHHSSNVVMCKVVIPVDGKHLYPGWIDVLPLSILFRYCYGHWLVTVWISFTSWSSLYAVVYWHCLITALHSVKQLGGWSYCLTYCRMIWVQCLLTVQSQCG